MFPPCPSKWLQIVQQLYPDPQSFARLWEFPMMIMMMIITTVDLSSVQTSMGKPCLWRSLGKSLCQINTQNTDREKDDGAVTDLKTSESWVACGKLRKTQESLIAWRRAFQSLGTELEKALKLNCLLVWFSSMLGLHRWNWEDDHRDCGDSKYKISSWRYYGAVPLK